MFALLGVRPTPAAAAPAADWVPVGEWSGTADHRTDPFEIEGRAFRILWSVSDVQPVSTVQILVYQADGTLQTVAVDATGRGDGTAEVRVEPGQYALEIDANNLPWSVSVEDDR